MMELFTERLQLREFTPEDAEALHAFESDPRVTAYLPYSPKTLQVCRDHIAKMMAQRQAASRDLHDFAICLQPGDHVIGRCGMKVDAEDRSAYLWYVLHHDYWGRGIVSEAAQRVMQLAFEALGVQRVWVQCVAENVASIRIATKLGMQPEGARRDQAGSADNGVDLVVLAIHEHEWRHATGHV